MSQHVETKYAIVETAIRLFKERGYNNVAVKDICSELNITRSAFYYYFDTKDAIVDYYSVYTGEMIYEHMLSESSTSRERFYSVFNIFAQKIEEIGPEINRLLLKRGAEMKNNQIAARDLVLWKVYLEIISKALETGEITSQAEPETLTEAVIYMVNGISLTWCNKNCNFDYTTECMKMIDILLGWNKTT